MAPADNGNDGSNGRGIDQFRRFALAERLADIGHWRLDLASGAVAWSDGAYRIHDIDRSAATLDLETALSAYVADDRDEIRRQIEICLREKSEFSVSSRIGRNGDLRHVIIRGLPEYDANGAIVAIFGIFQDATGRAAVELEAKNAGRVNAILRQTIEVLDEAVSIYDEADRFIYANRKYFDLFPYLRNIPGLEGRTFEEVLRVSLANGVVDSPLAREDPDAYVAERLAARRAGATALPDRLHSTGRWYAIREFRTEAGARITLRSDVTERRRTQRELEVAKERYDLAAEGGRVGVWDYDIAAGTAFWSDQALAILGLRDGTAPASLAGLEGAMDERDVSAFRSACLDCIAHRRPIDGEFRFRRSRGGPIWVLLRGRAIADAAGRTVRVAGSVADVTEIKQASIRLAEQNAALEKLAADLDAARRAAESASAAKSQFLAMMSHEIRTPMTAVLGMADVLRGTGLNEDQLGYLEVLDRSADHLLGLLNEILDLARIEAGAFKLELQPFDVRQSAMDVHRLFAKVAADKGIDLSFAFADTGPTRAVGDMLRFKQVLANLVGNAVKFTESGSVALSIETVVADGAIKVRGSVSDTGIGIAAESLDKVFLPFDQGDASTTRRFGGTGLGLAISKNLVEAMGGSIGVESQPGEGSRFHFELAMAPAPETANETALSRVAAPTALPPLSVLICEDNAINAELLSLVLGRYGHHAEIAADGRAGVEKAMAGPFDLILMDMQMPELDGPEATRLIRAGDGPNRDTPIVGLSADAMPEHRADYLAAGLDAFATKPVVWDKLFETFSHLYNAGRLRRRAS